MDNLIDLQYELRRLLYVRPYNIDDIELVAWKVCDAIEDYQEIWGNNIINNK